MYIKKGPTRGFTLIELLVVISIIGLLSSVVLASLNSARAKGRDARRLSDIKQLQVAMELAASTDVNNKYPASRTDLVTDGFIPVLPTDPSTGSDYGYVVDSTGYLYCIGARVEANPPPISAPCPTGATLGATACGGSACNYTVRP